MKRMAKIREASARCSAIISGRKRILFGAFFWNLVQRACQMTVPMLVYAALGGQAGKMLVVYAKQCLVTIGYNFIPVPGGMGISDYLMVDGFSCTMGEQMAYNVELISRGLMFYICVAASGVLTLIGYFWGEQTKEKQN